ncbi:MAG: hypothetical protein Athens071425_387 [Parcubacteria group bacterium Athens0714_25]|nr:MAG: hypothetical protein Athens071425_387 [Parcubacteria group bacterium Athens0714_25]
MALTKVFLKDLKEIKKTVGEVRCCIKLPSGAHVTGTFGYRGGKPHVISSDRAYRITPRMEIGLSPSTVKKIAM